MEDGILSLKWNNHNSTFIQTLSTLHNAETYSDVTIACEGRYFPVHKLVLSVCSEYFEEILSRTKCQHPVIVLKDIKHKDLEALLNYMYAGEANVTQNELASLIKAAECLRIKGLAVPDEAPPVRDKRRQTDVSESPNFNKRKRNDEVLNSNQQVYREIDLKCGNLRTSEQAKSDKQLEDSADHLADVSSDRIATAAHEVETYRNIPEIILEGQAVEVKQEVTEPKIEEHVEDESHQQLEGSSLSLAYGVDIVEESSEGDRQGHESHILHDLMTVPGPSGVHGHETLTSWENNANNITGYSVDSYSSDEGRNQQLNLYSPTRDVPDWDGGSYSNKNSYPHSCPYCFKQFPFKSFPRESSEISKRIKRNRGRPKKLEKHPQVSDMIKEMKIQPPRKRGRPSKQEMMKRISVSLGKKRRGRPKGSGKSKEKEMSQRRGRSSTSRSIPLEKEHVLNVKIGRSWSEKYL